MGQLDFSRKVVPTMSIKYPYSTPTLRFAYKKLANVIKKCTTITHIPAGN